jgi:outer membrane protein OmpA-like peptidoglycan-associated protein
MRSFATLLCFMVGFGGLARAQNIEIQADLLSPLGTQTSHKDDKVAARVTLPEALKGDTLEGKVTDVRSASRLRGSSVLNFTFDTLRHAGAAVPISAQIKSLANSKGEVDVDEDGMAVRSTGNSGKTTASNAVGGMLGGLGGLRSTAASVGTNAAGSIVNIEMTSDSPSIRLDQGSKLTLSARSRSGPALSALTPNAAPAAATAPPAPAAATAPLAPAAATAPLAPAPASSAAAAPATAAQSSGSSGQPDLTAVKANFIPGERTIFYDDFTDMAGDEPPPHWKVRGGSVTLMVAPGIRQLTTDSNLELTPNFKDFPKNFTLESVVMFQNPTDFRNIWQFRTKDGQDSLFIFVQTFTGGLHVRVNDTKEEIADTQTPVDFSQPISENVWIQNGRLQVYINENRVMDANQIELPELGSVALQTQAGVGRGESGTFGIRLLRFAESTPDFSQVISSSGRYVTHGILFDTDSDRLKSESAAVIKSIAHGLETNPNLKLQIEGHTDSTGAADHNLDLSKRRAEAVKAVLVSQFKVDAARLTTAGLGATKPIDSNDTPKGRAQNRRVELVRQ